jgi:hypothetical protein
MESSRFRGSLAAKARAKLRLLKGVAPVQSDVSKFISSFGFFAGLPKV